MPADGIMRIVGVDFSGARENNATWVCAADLDLGSNGLTVNDCYRPSRQREEAHRKLAEMLGELPAGSVAALDFPFSVPEPFARLWAPNATAMPDLWRAAAQMDYPEFEELRDKFAQGKKPGRLEPKRSSDPPESLSPLNIRMRKMTFHGMRMLHLLWESAKSTGQPLWIPPLPPGQPDKEHHVTLLEAMPGATLRRLGLPYRLYKNSPAHRAETRQLILKELPLQAAPVQVDLTPVYDTCRKNDDALDAVVAAVTGALWVVEPYLFHDLAKPEQAGDPSVMLTGKIYAPQQPP